MGFVYHANYLIWMDMARTEHLRERGMSYKQLEEQGTYLTVTDVHVRYRQPARYDDMIRIRCWVRDLASRRVIFGYTIRSEEHTSELQSRLHLVCRLLLEKKKKQSTDWHASFPEDASL